MRAVVPLLLFGILFVSSCKKPESSVELRKEDKLEGTLLFLGDNLTHSGEYIAYLDAVLYSEAKRQKKAHKHLINLGLPSETCSGLTETDREFPRPVIHSRIDRALEVVKPDTVFVCYGIVDGIFSPFSEERFAAFQDGINSIIEKVHAANANVVLMTPPPFEMDQNRQLGKKFRSADADEFGYYKLYENYDEEVIARYSDWILQQESRVDGVVDIRTPLLSYRNAMRAEDPEYTFRGVVLDEDAHKVIARTILASLGRDPALVNSIWKRYWAMSGARQDIMHPAWLTYTGYSLPEPIRSLPEGMPMIDAIEAADEAAAVVEKEYEERVKMRESQGALEGSK